MDQILTLLQNAFATGTNSVEAIVISIIAALLAARFVQVPVFAIVATLIDILLPVVYGLIENGNFAEIGTLLSGRVEWVMANLPEVGVTFLGYLVAIAVFFAIKSLLFRRG